MVESQVPAAWWCCSAANSQAVLPWRDPPAAAAAAAASTAVTGAERAARLTDLHTRIGARASTGLRRIGNAPVSRIGAGFVRARLEGERRQSQSDARYEYGFEEATHCLTPGARGALSRYEMMRPFRHLNGTRERGQQVFWRKCGVTVCTRLP
jgi:hypothetical protein